jgi:hypothetical protein
MLTPNVGSRVTLLNVIAENWQMKTASAIDAALFNTSHEGRSYTRGQPLQLPKNYLSPLRSQIQLR